MNRIVLLSCTSKIYYTGFPLMQTFPQFCLRHPYGFRSWAACVSQVENLSIEVTSINLGMLVKTVINAILLPRISKVNPPISKVLQYFRQVLKTFTDGHCLFGYHLSDWLTQLECTLYIMFSKYCTVCSALCDQNNRNTQHLIQGM